MKGLDEYLDPTYGVDEWTADLYCDECEEDTEQSFLRKWGLGTAVCSVCDNESEIEE